MVEGLSRSGAGVEAPLSTVSGDASALPYQPSLCWGRLHAHVGWSGPTHLHHSPTGATGVGLSLDLLSPRSPTPHLMRRPTTRVCANPECPVITDGERFCQEHQPKPWANASPSNLATRNNPAWRKAKRLKLKRNPSCEECGATTQVEVHHRKPIARGGSVTAQANLKTLCPACHAAAHGRAA